MNRLEKHCYAHSFIHFLLLDNCRWQIHLSTLHYCLHHLSTLYGLTSQLQVLAAKLALLRYGHRCHIGGCVSSPGRLYQAFAACELCMGCLCHPCYKYLPVRRSRDTCRFNNSQHFKPSWQAILILGSISVPVVIFCSLPFL